MFANIDVPGGQDMLHNVPAPNAMLKFLSSYRKLDMEGGTHKGVVCVVRGGREEWRGGTH